jgi:hypothetical protein
MLVLGYMPVCMCCALIADTSRIPRAEVEEIAECVMEHLGALLDGCEYTICGGYVGATSDARLMCARTDRFDLGIAAGSRSREISTSCFVRLRRTRISVC